jgi:predicted AAA+ superfamily ATPase
MQQLYTAFYKQLNRVSTDFKRYLYHEIRWQNRLIAIVGSRGTGKTTLLLQHIKLNHPNLSQEVLYASLDNLWFSTHTLIYLADEFAKQGGKVLYLDEVHNYSGWSREIKNIYDSYPDMKIVFTGSSLLEVYKGEADLSRRAVKYHLYGLSFREFIDYEYGVNLDVVSFDNILSNHTALAQTINAP